MNDAPTHDAPTSDADPRRLTCHVLDVTQGRPAAGLAFRLARLDGPDADVLLRSATTADGRSDGSLLAGDALVPGRYELLFAVGTYFGTDAYLDEVPVRFAVAPGTGHLHVALLVTPWSYTTYRGS